MFSRGISLFRRNPVLGKGNVLAVQKRDSGGLPGGIPGLVWIYFFLFSSSIITEIASVLESTVSYRDAVQCDGSLYYFLRSAGKCNFSGS